jgi:hypothetical protein
MRPTDWETDKESTMHSSKQSARDGTPRAIDADGSDHSLMRDRKQLLDDAVHEVGRATNPAELWV